MMSDVFQIKGQNFERSRSPMVARFRASRACDKGRLALQGVSCLSFTVVLRIALFSLVIFMSGCIFTLWYLLNLGEEDVFEL